MKNYIIILFSISSLICSNVIEQIVIHGNNITREQTILDLISHTEGDSINIKQAISDQETLFKTGLFYDAIIYPDSSIYNIIVFEKPKKIFRPDFDKDDFLGWSYGTSILFNNIKGKNRKLKINTLVGATNSIGIKYCNPKLKQTKDSLNININYKFYDNFQENYEIYSNAIESSITFLTSHPLHQIKILNETKYSRLFFNNGENEKNYFTINSIIYQYKTKKNQFDLKFSSNLFKKTYKNYLSVKFENKFYIYFDKELKSGRLLIQNQGYFNFANNIPIYQKKYLINENYIRGYDINNLPEKLNNQNSLLWNNIITSTIQIELPFHKTSFISTDLLLFWDWGIASNKYKVFNYDNKLKSYGLGIRYHVDKMGSVDICIGINPINAKKEIQGIVNFKSF